MELNLKMGKGYKVHDMKSRKPFEFDALYIGRNPVKVPWSLELDEAEGHTFIRFKNGDLETYCARTENQELKKNKLDYDDWGVLIAKDYTSIGVEKANPEFTNEEEQYLREVWKNKMELKAA